LKNLTMDVLKGELTEEEQETRIDEIARIIIRQEKEFEELERNSAKILGNDGLFISRIEEIKCSRRFITPQELENFVDSCLRMLTKKTRIKRKAASEAIWILENGDDLGNVLRYRLTEELRPGQYLPLTWRLSQSPELTFTSSVANENRRIEFITPRHPLIRSLVQNIEARLSEPVITENIHSSVDSEKAFNEQWMSPCGNIVIKTNELKSGEYYIFIYLITSKSVVKEMFLLPVGILLETETIYEEMGESFLRILNEGNILENPESKPFIDVNVRESMAARYVSNFINTKKEDMSKNNEALIQMRLESLGRTRNFRADRIKKTLEKVDNPSIRRMKTSELKNVEDRFLLDKKRIEQDRQIGIEYELQAVCRAIVKPDVNIA